MLGIGGRKYDNYVGGKTGMSMQKMDEEWDELSLLALLALSN